MKTTATLTLLYILAVCRLGATNNCDKAAFIIKTFTQYHVQPRAINDSLSSEIFDYTIRALDPREQYFTKEDINTLSKYRYTITKGVQEKNCAFVSDLIDVYRANLLRSDSIIDIITTKPFDFKQKDTITFTNRDEMHYADNRKALEKKWLKRFKYRVLVLQNPMLSTDSAKDKFVPATESELRAKLKSTYKKDISTILNFEGGLEEYVFDAFLNAIAERFDPHSNYLSQRNYNSFMNSVSAKEETYGLMLDENDNGEIVVERVLPGSSAWKSNEVHKGDILVQVQEPGKEPVDLTIADMQDVEAALYKSAAVQMNITLRKANGQMQTVLLQKEVVKVEENKIKSYILQGEKKLGYISLPDFYSDWTSETALGCANDVAREIIKMKQEGIEGLVLDMRFNGGGSMKEVTELAGIFIDEGALFLERPYGERPTTVKDPNRGTIYDGEMVVMVNGLSASAAEIFPSIMQDYNRAVVVGSNTFGKSTEQGMIPLFANPLTYSGGSKQADPKDGFVKITLAKMYRLSGKTYQREGVVPDVHLPDAYENIPVSEDKYTNALPNDTVDKKVYYKPLQALPVQRLQQASAARVQQDKRMLQLAAIGDSLSNMFNNDYKLELNAEGYKKLVAKYSLFQKQLVGMNANTSPVYKAENLAADNELIEVDSYRKEINVQQLKNIQEDIYIDEACHILSDLITFGSH